MNGFLFVASLDKKYLKSAILSAESLRDYYPDANIALFTHEEWLVDQDLTDLFDFIYTKDVPKHKRAKLWALDKTPFELTAYIDADMEFMHEDIQTIWDQMPNDKDILLTKIRDYAGALVYFDKNSEDKSEANRLLDHCGFFLYRNNEKTMAFMKEWWELYHKQNAREWNWDTSKYPEALRPWDQWTYWWLMNKTDFAIKRGYFEDDARWNFVNVYHNNETNKPIIIYHHTID